jgi:hypothetical protein
LVKRISEVQIVLRPERSVGWMAQSVAFQKVVRDRMFFSARSAAGRWTLASGLIADGRVTDVEKVSFGADLDFADTLTPNVLELKGGGFIMAFAGHRNRYDNRRLFIAHSSSLGGPWSLTDQTYVPKRDWEGRNVDLGPGNYSSDRTGYFFFSSAYASLRSIARSWLRSPTIPTRANLMRFQNRRIGLLSFDLEARKIIGTSESPLPLDSVRGGSFESVFCPGYLSSGGRHILFVTGSNYSRGFPFEQVIGAAESSAPPHDWRSPVQMEEVLGGKDMPGPLSSGTAFDTPDPVLMGDERATLYFSAMSRDDGEWHILRCDLAI